MSAIYVPKAVMDGILIEEAPVRAASSVFLQSYHATCVQLSVSKVGKSLSKTQCQTKALLPSHVYK